jgi:hypothetical protein
MNVIRYIYIMFSVSMSMIVNEHACLIVLLAISV